MQTDINRIAEDLWRLVQIPSPTCNERKAALVFAEMLSATGDKITVEIDESEYNSPAIIGRLKGNRPGKTLLIAGHIDHIDVAHPEPERKDNIISGRGSCDMKVGLAEILELVRVLQGNDCDFPGQILVTVYGLHEEPGSTRGIKKLIEKGLKADAAIIMEGPDDEAVSMTMGLVRWDIVIRQKGSTCHENRAARKRHELLKTLRKVIEVLAEKNDSLEKEYSKYQLINRAESLCIGQIHYGDYFNRLPNECSLQGTRRWHPNHTFEEIQKDLEETLRSIQLHPEVSISHSCRLVGHSYQVSPDEPILQSLLRSYKAIEGNQLRMQGWASVTDAQRLIIEAGIPAIIWGTCLENSHMDYEFVEMDKVERAFRIIFHTVLDYLDNAEDRS